MAESEVISLIAQRRAVEDIAAEKATLLSALPGNGTLVATHADRKELFLEAARLTELARPEPANQEATALEVGPESDRKPTEKKQGSQASAFELPRLSQRDRLALKLDPELGRIVETAQRPIGELLVEFITPAEGWQ